MFHQPIKTPPTSHKPLHQLTPVLSSDELLREKKRPELIQELAKLSEFEASHFETLGKRLLDNIANRCQRLPESTLYFHQPGGFLDHILQRTHAAMHLFRQYMIVNPDEPLSYEQQQWWYALFSASLLRGIGRLCLDYQVERYNPKGQFIKQWEPLLEPLGQINQHYCFEFKTHTNLALRHRLTLILARQLMPDNGFEWLVANPQILAVWLALLQEDEVGAGAFAAILERADAITIQDELEHLPANLVVPRTERRVPIGSFIDHLPELSVEKERMAAIEFIRWLEQALERGKFLLNKAPILAVPGGLLICPEAFQLFSREHEYYKNWQAVRHQLMSLPLYPTDQAQATLSRHEQHEGLLMPGHLLVPETIHIQSAGLNSAQATTATRLALGESAPQLSAAGVWVNPVAATQPSIQPKAPYG